MNPEAYAEWWADQVEATLEAIMPVGPKPRELSIRGLLIGVFLTGDDGRTIHLTQVHKTLRRLSATEKRRLGVPPDVSYRHVERTLTTLAGVVDPEPFKSRHGRAKPKRRLSADEADDREDLLASVVELFLGASFPPEFRDHASYAVDATDVEAWAKGTKRRRAADPTADWGHRKADAPGQVGEKFFGWQEQAQTMVPEESGPRVPELVRNLTLTAANVHQPPVSLRMLRRYVDAGGRTGDLLADSHYPFADGWMMGIWRLGFVPVVDIHSVLLGTHGTVRDAISVDDLLLCPMIPAHLIDPPRPTRDSSAADWRQYFDLVRERAKYAFKPHAARDAQGYQRMMDPAAYRTAICAHQDRSVNAPTSAVTIYKPPSPKLECCAGATMTIEPTVNEKLRQKYPYYSPEWHLSFNRRGGVERSFSSIKDAAMVDMRKGRIRVLGRTKNMLLRAVGYVVTNYRRIRAHLKLMALKAAGVVTKRAPRRTKHYDIAGEYVDGIRIHRPSANAPPDT